MAVNVEELYRTTLAHLDRADRLRLLALLANGLTASLTEGETAPQGLLELEGLGAELWRGLDAQRYVNELRDEWEQQHDKTG
jgi:hypothetical protein